jgi:putative phage-type endonuclease
MAIEKNKFNSREEWLAARQRGIGASEIPTFFGVNPYQTIEKLYLQKTSSAQPEEKANAAMAKGNEKEIEIIKWTEANLGQQVLVEKDMFYTNSDYPLVFASLDGETRNADGSMYSIVEAKTVFKREVWHSDEIPEHFYWQVMQQLAVCQPTSGMGYLVMHSPVSDKYKTFTVKWDKEEWEKAYERVELFWKNHVVPKSPPLSLSNADEIDKLLEEYVGLAESKKKIEKRYAELANILKLYMSTSNVRSINGLKHVAEIVSSLRNTFQTKLFQEEQPELAAKYTKASPVESLKIK